MRPKHYLQTNKSRTSVLQNQKLFSSRKMNYDLFLMNVIVILSKMVLAYLARWISPNLVQNRQSMFRLCVKVQIVIIFANCFTIEAMQNHNRKQFETLCQTMMSHQHGGVAQMVERSLSMREVLGSMPSPSKTFSFILLQ